MLSKWPRGLPLIFAVYAVYAMEPNKSEESGKVYLCDNQGKYAPKVGALSFSVQGLCFNSPGDCNRGTAPIRGVCPTTQGNDG